VSWPTDSTLACAANAITATANKVNNFFILNKILKVKQKRFSFIECKNNDILSNDQKIKEKYGIFFAIFNIFGFLFFQEDI
jgi:hypothetical protein